MFYLKSTVLTLTFLLIFSGCWGWGHGRVKPKHIKVKRLSLQIDAVSGTFNA